jgi:hypothetical protein
VLKGLRSGVREVRSDQAGAAGNLVDSQHLETCPRPFMFMVSSIVLVVLMRQAAGTEQTGLRPRAKPLTVPQEMIY